MNLQRISRASRKVAQIGVVAAALFAFVIPFPVANAASASHSAAARDYNVTLSCTTSTQTEVIGGLLQSGWKWYQGGANGTLLASSSLNDQCPLASGSNTVTASGTQPAKADTLFAWMEGGSGGCGGFTGKFVSFTPGSPVSLGMAMTATAPCSYQTNLPKSTVNAAFTLQS